MTIRPGDRLFVDTNILLAATDRSRTTHEAARTLIEQAGGAGWHLHINGQVVREYLAVATRPVDGNGLGLKAENALANIEQLLGRMTLLAETERVNRELLSLVASGELSGKRIHDAGIAATMIAHGVALLITDNLRDFRVFPNLRALAPSQATYALD